MKRMPIAILIIAVFCAAVHVLAATIEVTNIETKIVRGPDNDGDVWFAIKCAIRNNSGTDQRIFVNLQAVDVSGFELKTVYLSAKVRRHSFEIASTQSFMPEEDFRKARWRVKH
jgi:hypothetical protein